MSKNDENALKNAGKIIERFGGIRPMASKIDAPVTTVQGWKKRDVIPGTRRDQILKAASENNIDLSDLTNGSNISNQNKPEKKPTSVPQVSAVKHEEEYVAPKVKPARAHDDIMATIDKKNRQTAVQTVWITTGLILFAGVVATFLLLPTAQEKAERIDEKIVELESEVEDVNERTSFIKNLVPENMQQKMDTLQNQAQNIQNTVEQLSEKANAISGGVLGAGAGPLSKRLEVLEQQIGDISGDGKFAALMERISNLEASVAGQEQLKQSMDELRAMMGKSSGQTITEDLADAQEEQGALGQTLEGVSGSDLKAAAMLIAFSQMRNALFRQEPFENDLALLQRLAGEDNEELQTSIDRLAPHAKDGVLSPGGLSNEFKGLAGDIVVSSLKGEDVSIKEKAQARIHNVFKFEKDGELVSGTPTQQTVSKAQKLLDQGDIQGAIMELQSLDGPAAETALPFIQEAQASLLAEQVQKMLGNSILSKFTGQLPLEGILPNLQGQTDQMPNGAGTGGLPNINMPEMNMPAVPNMNDIQGSLGNMVPTQKNMVVDKESGVAIMPKSTKGIDLENVRESLENTVPVPQTNEVVKDEESGVTILPKQPSFKGFSGGQR